MRPGTAHSNAALKGTGLANTAVHFTIDDSPVATTVTADTQGAWSFTPTNLADGTHTIVTSQTDAFNNTGTASLSFTLEQRLTLAPTRRFPSATAISAMPGRRPSASRWLAVRRCGRHGDLHRCRQPHRDGERFGERLRHRNRRRWPDGAITVSISASDPPAIPPPAPAPRSRWTPQHLRSRSRRSRAATI